MLGSPDHSHFRKYLATLGMALILAGLSLPALFMRAQPDLLIRQEDLLRLTPTAQETVRQRQDYVRSVTAALPWLSSTVVVVGVAIGAYGMIGWARRQHVEDELRDTERELRKIEQSKGHLELKSLTDAEKVEKIEREVAEAESPASITDTTSRNDGARTRTEPLSLQPDSFATARNEYVRIERMLGQLLQHVFRDRLMLHLAVHVPEARSRELDAVVRPTSHEPGYVFEFKYLRSPKVLAQSLQSAVLNAVAGADVLSRIENKPYRSVAIIVADSLPQAAERRAVNELESYRDMFRALPHLILISTAQFERLTPKELSSLIADAQAVTVAKDSVGS